MLKGDVPSSEKKSKDFDPNLFFYIKRIFFLTFAKKKNVILKISITVSSFKITFHPSLISAPFLNWGRVSRAESGAFIAIGFNWGIATTSGERMNGDRLLT